MQSIFLSTSGIMSLRKTEILHFSSAVLVYFLHFLYSNLKLIVKVVITVNMYKQICGYLTIKVIVNSYKFT